MVAHRANWLKWSQSHDFHFIWLWKSVLHSAWHEGGKYSSLSVWYFPLWWTFSALISSSWIQIHWNVKHPYNPSWKNKKLFLIYYLVSLSSLTASFKFSNTGGLCLRSATVYYLCKIIECMSEWVGPVDTIDCACAVSLRGCGLVLIMLQGQISVTHTYIVRWHCDICFFSAGYPEAGRGKVFHLDEVCQQHMRWGRPWHITVSRLLSGSP